jgi:hypothetical protein
MEQAEIFPVQGRSPAERPVGMSKMIVELTGVPGVGKTTFFRQLRDKVKAEITLFSDEIVLERYSLAFIPQRLLRRAVMDILLFCILLRHAEKYKHLIWYIISIAKLSKEKTLYKLNIIRNAVLKCARFVFIQEHLMKEIVVVDEGISHIPFNMAERAILDKIDAEYILKLFKKVSGTISSLNVVILDREMNKVKESLYFKGHKRISNRAPYLVEQFLYCNAIILKAYKEVPGHVFASKHYIQLESGNGIQTLIQLVENGKKQ